MSLCPRKESQSLMPKNETPAAKRSLQRVTPRLVK
jgi:hypothetical protein